VNTALYLRSSKDRSDVSIDAQRRELRALAAKRGLKIIEEYVDAVESAKDENRPGFQRMVTDMRSSSRQWTHLLLLDTSRLARNRLIAIWFKREAEKRGVEVIFSKLPDTDPLTKNVLHAVFEAFDEYHSMVSREKGMAGMKENVRKGYRAGGRAPYGYSLRKVSTNTMRDGKPVMKSTLKINDHAPQIADYLRGMAAGRSRTALATELGLNLSQTTLIGIEWNALTYAGHTVWGVHAEHRKGDGYKGKPKRRPRSEWVIQRDTHPAIITDAEAEAILNRLIESKRARGRRKPSTYALSGLLKTPTGRTWQGNGRGGYYVRGQSVPTEAVERAVIERIIEDVSRPTLLKRLYREIQCQIGRPRGRKPHIIERDINRLVDLLPKTTDPDPLLRKIEALEVEKKRAQDQAEQVSAKITLADLKARLRTLRQSLQSMAREDLNEHLSTIIERVQLDPATLEAEIYYRADLASRDGLASPRGFEPLLQP
jgi:DNA invertase Pin-like site-specific DNA recombinase